MDYKCLVLSKQENTVKVQAARSPTLIHPNPFPFNCHI